MAWDDEAEQLTLEVVGRLGVAALDGVYAQAIDDVQRSGLEVLVVEPESCPGVLPAPAPGPRMFAGDHVWGIQGPLAIAPRQAASPGGADRTERARRGMMVVSGIRTRLARSGAGKMAILV